MDLLTRIKEISEERGLSLKEVAIKAGIGENSIYRWRYSKPSVKSLSKIAAALNIDLDDLTTDPANKETPEYRAIQRRAKKMTPENQKRLLQIMDLTFNDIDSEGEHHD